MRHLENVLALKLPPVLKIKPVVEWKISAGAGGTSRGCLLFPPASKLAAGLFAPQVCCSCVGERKEKARSGAGTGEWMEVAPEEHP